MVTKKLAYKVNLVLIITLRFYDFVYVKEHNQQELKVYRFS